MADKTKIKIEPYRIVVRIRGWYGEVYRTKGYPVKIEGFYKYKFAVHRKIGRNDKVWVVTELSSGIAFRGGFETRTQAAEDAAIQLNAHKEKFIKKIHEFQFQARKGGD